MRHEVTHFCNALFYSFREKNRTHLLLVFIYCKYLTTISPAAVVTLDQRFEIVFVSPASAIDKTLTLIGHSVVPPSWNGCEAESSILWHRTNVHWWSCYIIKIKGWSLIERKLLLSPLYFGREQMSLGWTVMVSGLQETTIVKFLTDCTPDEAQLSERLLYVIGEWMTTVRYHSIINQLNEWDRSLFVEYFDKLNFVPLYLWQCFVWSLLGLQFFFTYLLGKHKLIYYVQF